MARLVVLVLILIIALLLAAPEPGAGTGEPPAGRIIFLTNGNRLNSIDVATGELTVRRVSVATCGPEMYVTGGRVIFAELRRRRTVVYSVPVALDSRPTRLGSAHRFVPSATAGRVWLAGTDCHRRRMVGVKEVDVDGQVTFTSERRVPASWLTGAVEGGLVFQHRRSVSVWDPSTGASRDLAGVEGATAVQGNSIFGCALRSRCRSLLIADSGTEARVAVRPPASRRLDLAGKFSPNGSHVALAASAKRRWSVALVNAGDGTTTIVPGSRTSRTYPHLSWSPSSGWLYFLGPGRSIMAYRPGEGRAVRLPFRLPRQAATFMAG
jgi:hypothetical protein